MEQLEYVPKKVYNATINRLTPGEKNTVMMNVSGEVGDTMNSPCMVHEMTQAGNLVTAYVAFPLYNSEMTYWTPGKKLKITVEVVE
jgi:uncharacterized protein (DUF1810 family)